MCIHSGMYLLVCIHVLKEKGAWGGVKNSPFLFFWGGISFLQFVRKWPLEQGVHAVRDDTPLTH